MPVGVIFPVLAKEFARTSAWQFVSVYTVLYTYIFATAVGSRLSPLPDVCVCVTPPPLFANLFSHMRILWLEKGRLLRWRVGGGDVSAECGWRQSSGGG
jgi:hypothetical protein